MFWAIDLVPIVDCWQTTTSKARTTTSNQEWRAFFGCDMNIYSSENESKM
jgi:hypothetical protein